MNRSVLHRYVTSRQDRSYRSEVRGADKAPMSNGGSRLHLCQTAPLTRTAVALVTWLVLVLTLLFGAPPATYAQIYANPGPDAMSNGTVITIDKVSKGRPGFAMPEEPHALVVAGIPGFVLRVLSRDDFLPTDKVCWDGMERPTTFVSSHELHVTIAASDIARPGLYTLTIDDQHGELYSGFGTGSFSFGSAFMFVMPRNLNADFNGDGATDVTAFNPLNGMWCMQSSVDQAQVQQFGSRGDVPVPGDYDGDGVADLAVFRPSDGTWRIRESSTRVRVVEVKLGGSTDIPVPADYDGDGKTDVAVWQPSNGTWYVQKSSDGTLVTQQLGESEDVPVPGDYDGDGKTDCAVFRHSNTTWYVLQSRDGFLDRQWGQSGDEPVPGDYDGDGKTDFAVFRPGDGIWDVQGSTQGLFAQQFGSSGDLAMPGDYDGDGKTDYAVFRPSHRTWYLLQSQEGYRQQRQHELPLDDGFLISNWY